MSFFGKYNVIIDHLETVVQAITGLENVTINRGEPNTPNERPALNLSLVSAESADEGNVGFENTVQIALGLDVLWEEESTFITKLDAIIDEINDNGRDACGVEQIWVSGAKISEENKKYRSAVLTITAIYWS